eukprot:CAMPEP_0173192756 /NCGR_PEP_ID=MMETSP1141-20130122/13588_1 /TAXON_ID=483371 /ORGANISM="non described non described, Strain CCMP2298" /LENGTH=100 /DNA_ID=CAMNT_0014117033 /DNA_START=1077 /DNA_END=1379 /DNA_ORIENTATION=-
MRALPATISVCTAELFAHTSSIPHTTPKRNIASARVVKLPHRPRKGRVAQKATDEKRAVKRTPKRLRECATRNVLVTVPTLANSTAKPSSESERPSLSCR